MNKLLSIRIDAGSAAKRAHDQQMNRIPQMATIGNYTRKITLRRCSLGGAWPGGNTLDAMARGSGEWQGIVHIAVAGA